MVVGGKAGCGTGENMQKVSFGCFCFSVTQEEGREGGRGWRRRERKGGWTEERNAKG